LTTFLVAGAGTAAALASPRQVGAGRSAAVAVPWRQAGPGWAIAEYSASVFVVGQPTQDKPGVTTLYLTSRTGAKYPFFTWPKSQFPNWTVVDWSGDRQRVLVEAFGSPDNRYEQISLATGKIVSRFHLPATVQVQSYTRPNGLNVLAMRPQRGAALQVVRYDLSGRLARVLTTSRLPLTAIDSPDGASVIAGEAGGLERVSNLGGHAKKMSPPIPVLECQPVRWWTTSTVLGSCLGLRTSRPRLWLFPVNGGHVAALTPQRTSPSPDLGDLDGWQVSHQRVLYLQAIGAFGACGTETIMRQWRNGTAHVVNVPFTSGDNRIVTGVGDRLLVWGKHPCGPGGALLWYNPGDNVVNFILRAVNNVVGVTSWAPYGRPLA
jgi:hypothetical protein